MNIDIEHLKQVALAASPGPWLITEHEQEEAYDANYTIQIGEDDSIDDRSYYPHAPSRIEDARFIAAANPAVVLELVAEVERLRAVAPNSPAREAAERQSIAKDPRFVELVMAVRHCSWKFDGTQPELDALIAHINTWGARRDAEAEKSRDLIESLHAALRSVNAVAIERGDKYGVCDQVDNAGEPYQSAWLDKLLRDGAAPAAGNTDKPKEDP